MLQKHVVIVGGGFAGLACAKKLAKNKNIRITLLDRHNYHQFKPLLYQVAASELSPSDVATPLRILFESTHNVDIKMVEVTSIDPKRKTVTTKDGKEYSGDFLVIAAGSQANFFGVKGAESHTFPLYSLEDANRLRTRILSLLEAVERDQSLVHKNLLTFVIVGAGPTGTELAGGLADMIHYSLAKEFSPTVSASTKIHLVDFLPSVLSQFSEKAQKYAEKELLKRGVILHLNNAVNEVTKDFVLLADGSMIPTHTVIWAGGVKAAPLSSCCTLPLGRGGRIDVKPDLTLAGFPGIYVLGDFANIPSPDGKGLPQLGSVARQCGSWAAKNILHEIDGSPRENFHYFDKGIMAIIGRNSGVVELGKSRFEFEGFFAFVSWLVVHAALLPTFRQKIETLISWACQYCTKSRALQLLDRSDLPLTDIEEKDVIQ